MDQADAVRALTDAQFETLLDRLLSIAWPVPAARMLPLAEGWGWSLVSEADEEFGFEADPGYGLAAVRPADFTPFEGNLSKILVATSDYVDEPTDTSRDAVNDAFARQVAVADRRLGEPVSRRQGEVASVTWDLPNGARIIVARSEESSWVQIADPETAQVRRLLGN